ncbi:MAG: HPr-rel-A system PqqD family peptide chaperone, partial [Clostridia bacterium]|nr:HPr-rel-A system PqqD family peptide chaperone [Clostridia bacterium]
VFDPKSGDTHLLDEVGISILDNLNEPISLESLLERLCEEYDATPEEIRSDVEEFLAEMIQKAVVILV